VGKPEISASPLLCYNARYLIEVRKRISAAAEIQKEVLIEFRKHTDITLNK
jgi:hypothetical protein